MHTHRSNTTLLLRSFVNGASNDIKVLIDTDVLGSVIVDLLTNEEIVGSFRMCGDEGCVVIELFGTE